MDVDLEGRSDDKIRIMEQVHELQSNRADKQVIVYSRFCVGDLFYKGLKIVIMLDSVVMVKSVSI